MNKDESLLWALETDFWLGDADIHRARLAGDAVMVLPEMILTKSQTVASIASGSRWRSVSFSHQRFVRLRPEAMALIYRTAGSRDHHEAPYSALASGVYVRGGGEWRLTLHHQSPLTSSTLKQQP